MIGGDEYFLRRKIFVKAERMIDSIYNSDESDDKKYSEIKNVLDTLIKSERERKENHLDYIKNYLSN